MHDVTCVACGDGINGRFFTAPCGDAYDSNCLNDLYEAIANGDQSLFPARCCRQEIPFEDVRALLKFGVALRYSNKAKEFSVLNQLYCPNPSCSRFLGVASDKEKGSKTCDACETVVCTLCKQMDHPSFIPCHNDLESEALIALGKEEHWQRCPGCHRMVELDHGCYHMTCLCRTQFCYLCAEIWKNCTCPQWDENRLVNAAEQQIRVQHQVPEFRPLNDALQAIVATRAEELRVNHECQHRSYRKVYGRAQCEICYFMLPTFILVCGIFV